MKIICFFAAIFFIFNSCVYAKDTDMKLSVDDAVEKAVSYSRKIAEAKENKAENEEDMEDTLNDIKYASEDYSSLKLRLMELQDALENYDANIDVLKNEVKLSVIKVFVEIINAENEIELGKEYIKIAEKELAASEIRFERGLLSKADYESQKVEYEKYKTDIENLEIDLNGIYIELGKLMGTDIETKYNIALDMEYTPLDEIDIDKKVGEILNESLYIKEKNDDIYLSEYEQTLFNSDTSYVSKISKENEIEQYYRDKEEYEAEINQQVRSLYNSILNSENEYEKSIAELEYMKKELGVLEIKYYMGKASEIELENYRYEVKELEHQIRKEIYNHGILIIQLENIQ